MSTYDQFINLLKRDYKVRGLTIPDVAEAVGMGPRQFSRHIKGQTKERVMPVQTVADLRRVNVISEDTVEMYWQGIRAELKFKARKKEKAAR